MDFVDVFNVSENVLRPSQQPVTILVEYGRYPGPYSLVIFNSAGEHIKTLEDLTNLSRPVSQTYQWDGKNKYGDTCASGVYILDLVEPYDRKERKLLIVR